MALKRNPARLLVILGMALTIAVAASAEEAMLPAGAASPELPVAAQANPAPADLAAPQAPAAMPAPIPVAAQMPVMEAPAAAEMLAAPQIEGATVEFAVTEGAEATSAEAQTDASFFSPPLPPRSLQSLVDERRDQLRAERSAALGADTPGAMPPWFADYNAGVARYRDAMRSFWRQRRDYDQLRHDSWMDAICPWSKPQRDWSRQRSFATQMRQLDRREAMEAYRFAPPSRFGAPPRW